MSLMHRSETPFGPDVVRFAFNTFQDNRGSLCPLDFAQLPFIPAHIYFVSRVPSGVMRGGHAHKRSEQLLLCVAGEIHVTVQHLGQRATFALREPGQAVYLRPAVWSEQAYCSPEACLLVLSSRPYDPADYVTAPDDGTEVKRS